MEKCNNYQFLSNNLTDENIAKCLTAVFTYEVSQNTQKAPTIAEVIDIINSKSREELFIYLSLVKAPIDERGMVLWQ